MKKNFTVLLLSGTLTLATSVPALATSHTYLEPPVVTSIKTTQAVSDTFLYYGSVEKIITDDAGKATSLLLNSEQHGEYVMNITSDTVWIDSGNKVAANPSDLKVDEGIYVVYGPTKTASLPPQSEAIAVVTNLPQDVASAQYYVVSEITLNEDNSLQVTNTNGNTTTLTTDTTVSSYLTKDLKTIYDITPGSAIMVWGNGNLINTTEQATISHIMLLPEKETASTEILTRSDLVAMLYDEAGKPDVDTTTNFTDVNDQDENADAIYWAASENLVSGYTDGSFGVNDPLTLEQFITIAWRYNNTPMLMDYNAVFTQYDDAKDISGYARHAMNWAHQKGILADKDGNLLSPKASITKGEAETMLNYLANQA